MSSDLIYDVGMHMGEDTEFYLKKGFRVVGFEANPDLIASCAARFVDEISTGRLAIVEGAIADVNEVGRETITFYRNQHMSVWGTIDQTWAERNVDLGTAFDTIEVQVVDFAAALATHGVPHYLKIDIEGADVVCLRSLEAFEARPHYVSIESDKRAFDRLEAEIRLLVDLGYTSFQAVQQVNVSQHKEPRPSLEGRWVGHRFSKGSSGLFGADLPGTWLDSDEIIEKYRWVFRQYALWGDYGRLGHALPARMVKKLARLALRRPLAGWYDTHARHASVG